MSEPGLLELICSPGNEVTTKMQTTTLRTPECLSTSVRTRSYRPNFIHHGQFPSWPLTKVYSALRQNAIISIKRRYILDLSCILHWPHQVTLFLLSPYSFKSSYFFGNTTLVLYSQPLVTSQSFGILVLLKIRKARDIIILSQILSFPQNIQNGILKCDASCSGRPAKCPVVLFSDRYCCGTSSKQSLGAWSSHSPKPQQVLFPPAVLCCRPKIP